MAAEMGIPPTTVYKTAADFESVSSCIPDFRQIVFFIVWPLNSLKKFANSKLERLVTRNLVN